MNAARSGCTFATIVIDNLVGGNDMTGELAVATNGALCHIKQQQQLGMQLQADGDNHCLSPSIPVVFNIVSSSDHRRAHCRLSCGRAAAAAAVQTTDSDTDAVTVRN